MQIPLSFLLDASETSLENVELKHRELAAMLKREAREIHTQAEDHTATADLALWLRQNRGELLAHRQQPQLLLRYEEPRRKTA